MRRDKLSIQIQGIIAFAKYHSSYAHALVSNAISIEETHEHEPKQTNAQLNYAQAMRTEQNKTNPQAHFKTIVTTNDNGSA